MTFVRGFPIYGTRFFVSTALPVMVPGFPAMASSILLTVSSVSVMASSFPPMAARPAKVFLSSELTVPVTRAIAVLSLAASFFGYMTTLAPQALTSAPAELYCNNLSEYYGDFAGMKVRLCAYIMIIIHISSSMVTLSVLR